MTEFPVPVVPFPEISQSLQKIIQQMVEGAVPQSEPFLLHMLGIPGAGKSSFMGALSSLWPVPHPVLLGFDQVMEQIPEYQSAKDKKEAFLQHELPARAAGYHALKELLHRKADILFDNGGSAASHLDILRYARDEMGYRLAVVSLSCCPVVARERIIKRFETTGHYTPHEYLEDRAEKILKLRDEYAYLTPHYYEIENMGNDETDKARFFADISTVAGKVYQDLNFPLFSARVGT